jgi:hypothetical protein
LLQPLCRQNTSCRAKTAAKLKRRCSLALQFTVTATIRHEIFFIGPGADIWFAVGVDSVRGRVAPVPLRNMKTHLRRRLMAFVWLTALGMTGCMTPNTREVNIGSVTARAHLREGVASYYQIEIRRPTAALAPSLLLKLPDGRILDRKSFTYPALKQAGFLGPEGGDFNPNNPYSHELSRYGVSFFFNQGTLVLMRISETTGPVASIAGERAKIFRTLPFSQEILEKLFGRPEKTSDKFQL